MLQRNIETAHVRSRGIDCSIEDIKEAVVSNAFLSLGSALAYCGLRPIIFLLSIAITRAGQGRKARPSKVLRSRNDRDVELMERNDQ